MKLFVVLAFILSGPWAFSKSKIRYPRVQEVKGSVFQVESQIEIKAKSPQYSEKQKALKVGQSLKDKAWLRTGEKGELRLALHEKATLLLEPNTEVNLPAITWEDGGVQEVILIKGKIRYLCQSHCERKISAQIYESVLPVGDYILSYDPKIPQVELSVFSGETAFRGLENEASVVLKMGERASFQGVLENGEPGFDVLLKGRKVAKGKLSEVQKIPEAEMKSFQKKEEAKLKALQKPSEKKKLSSQICAKPLGELNQCAWVCEKNSKSAKSCQTDKGAVCVRMRCNANGEWADRMELSSSQSRCSAKALVGMCDY
ncbi:MAG: hypothetical protein ACAH59_05045 [Pseudobdellovibrionaceae bacterium]